MLYDNDEFERGGRTFTFKTEGDDSHGAPWEEEDGHGVVSDWTRRDKAPSERVLHADRSSKRYYDVAATMRIARKDDWGLCDADKAKLAKKLGRTPTHGDIVAEAVDRDYEHMRRWCADLWQYVGVIVTHEESGECESLWGIESEDDDYLEMTAHDLADEINARLDKQLAATIAESRPDLAPNYL
jgi:hypothetical protein